MVDSAAAKYGASVSFLNPIMRNGLYEIGKVLLGSFKIKCDKISVRSEF